MRMLAVAGSNAVPDIALVHNRDPTLNHAAALKSLLEQCKSEVWICAPFISREGVRILHEILSQRVYKNSSLSIRVLLCDSPDAYITGHIDLDALAGLSAAYTVEYRAYGDSLHAKVVIADQRSVLLTSANLTGGGLRSNLELGVVIRDRELVQGVCEEFKRAWRDAQELTGQDIIERTAWCKQNATDSTPSVSYPWSRKIPWKPLSAGGRSVAGTDIFPGFNEQDFRALDPTTYGGDFADRPVKPEVVAAIQKAIAVSVRGRLERFYLAIKDFLPDRTRLYPHFATRLRVRNFYPSASWLALSRDPDRYVNLAQLSVGIGVDRAGEGLFIGFNMGEEYEVNEDTRHFLKWIRDTPNELLALLANLDPKYELRYHAPTALSLPVRDVTVAHLENILRVPSSGLLNLSIERQYSWAHDRKRLERATIVREAAEQFAVLYPIYRSVCDRAAR